MVKAENLSFGYKNREVFSNTNLTLTGGGVYGLFGKNGIGKTTLLKLIHGLLIPNEGDIYCGEFLAAKREKAFMQNLFYVPEQFSLPDTTADRFTKVYSRFYPKFDQGLYERNLATMELRGGEKLKTLSFGYKKRFLLTFALSAGVDYLLLDEPTNGLDIPSKKMVRTLLAEAIADSRLMMISTHQARDLSELIDRAIILNEEGLLLNRTLAEIAERVSLVYGVEAIPDALYSEKAPGGTVSLVEKGSKEQEIDIEVLFNFALVYPEKAKQLFGKEEAQ